MLENLGSKPITSIENAVLSTWHEKQASVRKQDECLFWILGNVKIEDEWV